MTDEARKRKERREAEERAALNDDREALATLRAIRDNPFSLDADKLTAIKLIMKIKEGRNGE